MKFLKITRSFFRLAIYVVVPIFSFSFANAYVATNTTCANAITINPSSYINCASGDFNSIGTSATPTNMTCGNPGTTISALWYKFEATSSIHIITVGSLSGLSNTTTYVGVLSGDCGTAKLACSTVASPLVVTGLTAGATYYVVVYIKTATTSSKTFNICIQGPPSNDDCNNAMLLPTSTTTCLDSKGILDAATASGEAICANSGTADDDVWFKFVATSTNPTITLSNISTNLSNSGARLQLFSGTCGSLSSSSCGTTSITASGLTKGNTYYVRVYSFGNTALSNATFEICVKDPGTPSVTDSTSSLFTMDTIAKKLGYPWEITYGPDDSLWITEARGYRVLRVSSARTELKKNDVPQQVLQIPLGSSMVKFDRSVGIWPQGGMQGLAIHPDFMTNSAKRWVYLSYVFDGTCASNSSVPCVFRTKIIRCQFYFAADAGNPTLAPKHDTLIILDTLISNLSGSNDHNSGRMKIGPVKEGPDNTYKLYYTIGDMGAGQFNNATRTNNAQNRDTCEGKIIRLNTEPDTDGDPATPIHDYDKWRKWIPNDNPFTHSRFTSVRTPVYSYGHRNPQGIIWGNINNTWRLYSSEHGDKSDDEVNIIKPGLNYGWPKVTGMDDDNYNTFDNFTNNYVANDILANQTVNDEKTFSSATSNYTNPIFDFFNWSAAQIETTTSDIFTWPTIAPSSIDIYQGSQPGWKNSLLVTSLKYGMYRLKLNDAGDVIDSTVCSNLVDTLPLLHSWRVRDIAISPNGSTIWAVIDSSGSTSGPTGGFNGGSVGTKDGGKVLRLTFNNYVVLPVNFISFTGKLQMDNSVRLDWKVGMVENFSYFDVQRSADGYNFSSIGKVSGSPPYQFVDRAPLYGNNYYRIRAVDKDGKATFSKVIIIAIRDNYAISLFPNPVKDVLTVKMASKQKDKVNVQLCDVQGKVLSQVRRDVEIGTNVLQINMQEFSPQVYILKITDMNGNLIDNQKIIKL